MNNNPFERSAKMAWIGIAIIMAVPVAFISIMAFMTIGGTSAFCIPFYIGIFLIFALICSLPIIQLKTKYTDSGIEQPSLFGYKFLHWQDVKEIRNITTGGMILIGSDTKINVNLFLFKNPQGLLSEIRSRIPESAYPSDTEINNEIYRRKQNDAGRSIIGTLIALVLVIVIGKNMSAVIIISLLMLAFMIYEIRNWLKYRSLQS
jgi:uncharacterized membrane protein YhaH (DUF805 family)